MDKSATTETARRQFTLFDAVYVGVLVATFLYIAHPSLAGGFQPDELTSMYLYWSTGAIKSLWNSICFWQGMGRPAGALYYLPLYHLFWLNPKPYHIVQIAILGGSIPIVYCLARLLSSSSAVAFLAVLVLYCHAQLANLVYLGSYIYDVLCGFFYFAALTYYVRIREKDFPLRPIQLLGFLVLYVCALNSKEMAVTLPLIVLTYEALRCPRLSNWKDFLGRNWRFLVPSFIAGLLTVPYVYSKTMSTYALARVGGYRPAYSWDRFLMNNASFVGELLEPYRVANGLLRVFPKAVIALWATVFIYALLRRDRTLQLMTFWVIIVPLPLAFIPIRGGACLYLVLFGWTMIFGQLASDVINLSSKCLTLLGRRSRRNSLPNRRATPDRFSAPMVRAAVVVLLGLVLAILMQVENRRSGRIRLLVQSGQKVVHVIHALSALDLHPAPGSMILLRQSSLFPNAWHTLFIAALVWNDHALHISVEGASDIGEPEMAKMNYVISLSESKATLEHVTERSRL